MQKKERAPIDMPLLAGAVLLTSLSLVILYSSSGEDIDLLTKQVFRIVFAFALMLLFAYIPVTVLVRWSPHLYILALVLLIIVLAVGITGKGAQRWIPLGPLRFQPAELMKLVLPMMLAWLLTRAPLPPRPLFIFLSVLLVLVPVALVILQPDLGTAILIALAGITVLFLAGIGWKLITSVLVTAAAAAPLLWVMVLHDYQKRRILTFFDPWSDPLGAGYHTIQSTIAIGSGGVHGKGWLAGTQSRLDFIPERSTDFVFAVFAEEFGLIGALLLLALYLFMVLRGLMISFYCQDTYARLLGSCISISFFSYIFVNIAMVSGLLPVVGVPLPLISYGGTSMVTLMIGFGILMSIRRHKNTLS